MGVEAYGYDSARAFMDAAGGRARVRAPCAEGRRFCLLYTNLSNPAFSSIYSPGCHPVADAMDWNFIG